MAITAAAGGGNWTDGGTWVGGVAPTASDDAILDGTSGNVTVSADSACMSLDCTGYTGTLTINAFRALRIGHTNTSANPFALKLAAGMTLTVSSSSNLYLGTYNGGTQQTVDFAGKTWGCDYLFLGNVSLSSAANFGSAAAEFYGDLLTNGYAVTGGEVVAYNAVVLGASTVSVSSWYATGTITAGTSTILMRNAGSKSFTGNGQTYNIVSVTAGATYTFEDSNTYAQWTLTGTGATTIKSAGGTTQTFTGATPLPSGSAGNVITYASKTNTVAYTFSKASGAVSVDYVSIRDSAASGGATFTAGVNSTDVSGNTGWTFESAAGGAGVSGATITDSIHHGYFPKITRTMK